MNDITIHTELCERDRATLAKLTDLLEKVLARREQPVIVEDDDLKQKLRDALAGAESTTTATDPQETAQEPTKVDTLTDEPPKAETPTDEAEGTTEEPKKPSVTLAELQQKVIQLCKANKKEAVREVVHRYAPTVQQIPAGKYDEVYEKLTALEG